MGCLDDHRMYALFPRFSCSEWQNWCSHKWVKLFVAKRGMRGQCSAAWGLATPRHAMTLVCCCAGRSIAGFTSKRLSRSTNGRAGGDKVRISPGIGYQSLFLLLRQSLQGQAEMEVKRVAEDDHLKVASRKFQFPHAVYTQVTKAERRQTSPSAFSAH
ncbi:hypothetical protein VTI74DRAFT_5811 [Chaetomium olivicolor]